VRRLVCDLFDALDAGDDDRAATVTVGSRGLRIRRGSTP
jgi:hypothetical protein